LHGKLKYGLYILYVLAAVAVSLYVRFPSDDLRIYAIRQIEGLMPGLEAAVAEVRPGLPAAVRFQTIEALYRNRKVLSMEQARLSPAWGAMLSFDPVWRFQAVVGGGRLQALIRLQENGSPDPVVLQGNLDRIELGELSGLQDLLGRRISGLCSGTASPPSGPSATTTAVALQLTDVSVELKQPILQSEKVLLQSIQIDAALTAAGLQIRQCTFRGSEFDGRLAGRIGFGQDFSASTIELEGAIMPHTVLLARLKRILPETIMAKREKGGEFLFLLSGSLENPRYSLR